ncbi:MAG: IS1634 family transposase, partial [Nitrospirota bacterium]|nr:IS1634 family transposase [Nitrospirota bacterium]
MVYIYKDKNSSGNSVWYLGENKKINGTSKRVWSKYIGTAKAIKKMVEFPQLPLEIESVSYGLSAALLNINKEISFSSIIDKHCSKRDQDLTVGEHILIDVINRIDEQNSHNKLEAWFQKTMLREVFPVKQSYLSSQSYWNHWQYLDEDKIEAIQKDLLPKIIKDVDIKQLFYDPTNFTTYIADKHKENPKGKNRHEVRMAKYGKSKNRIRGLNQINLALLVTKDFGIPLWHKPYDGNINDVTFFKTFINSLIDKVEVFAKECKSITLVMDKGNNSPPNIKRISKDLHFYVLGSLAPSQYEDLLEIPLNKFDVEYTNSKGETYKAYALRNEVFGKQCNVVITYYEKTAYNQRERTERALAKALAYLEEAKSKLNRPKWKNRDEVLVRINSTLTRFHAKGLVDWELKTENKKLKLNFSENKERLSYFENSYGKSILFTDNDILSTEEIIKAYHDKYIVEQQIRQLKNKHMISLTPEFCWTDESCRVHAFTCVMALLFLSLLKKKIHETGLKMTNEEIVDSLKGIRKGLVLMPKQEKVIPMIEKMDEIQKKLFDALNLG